MVDYERSTERETRTVDPHAPAAVSSRRVSERVVEPAGPGPVTVAMRVVTFAFGVLQALLVLRIILLLLIANPGNDVVSFILGVTDPFVEPFVGMFQLDRVTGDEGSILDVAAIVALIGWTLVEAVILAGLRIFSRSQATA
jgi:YGGT family